MATKVKKSPAKKSTAKKNRTLAEVFNDAAEALRKNGVVIAATEKPAGKVTGVIPTGTSILVEILTSQELQGTTLFMPEDSKGKGDCDQAYVLAMGPKVPTDLGFKVGDRVMLLAGAGGNPLPSYKEGRKQYIVEPHVVRCVLTED